MSEYFKGLTVMVIDDQSTMRSIVRQLLRQLGVGKIEEAENGADAVSRLQADRTQYNELSLIICDLHMDKMNGLEFVRQIRGGSVLKNKDIPILILTGDSDDLMDEVVLQVGATKILKKPISSENLGKEIRAVVKNNASFIESATLQPGKYFGNQQVETYKAGDVIFSQGSEGGKAYIVTSGRVGLSSVVGGEKHSFGVAEKNSLFGEMSLFDDNRRLVTATALEDVECTVIDEQYMQCQLSRTPLFVRILLQAMVQRIKSLRSARKS